MSSEASRMKLNILKVKKLQNELLNAVKKFDSKKVIELVALKVNVNIVDQYGNHLIFILLKECMRSKFANKMQIYNYKEKARIILKCLLTAKVIKLEELFQPRKQDPKEKYLCAYSGYTPLMIASLIGDKNLVNLLIEYGNAKVNTRSKEADNPLKLLCPQFKVTNEPIQGFTAIMAAMVRGDLELIRYLVEKGATLCEITSNGWYPFRLLYLSQLLVNPFDADFVSEVLTMGTVVQINSSDQETVAQFRSLLAQRNLLDEQVFQRLRNLASCERYFSTVDAKIKLIFEIAANKLFNTQTLKSAERELLEPDDIMDDKTCIVLKSRNRTLDNFLHVAARSGNVDALKAGVKLLSGCKKDDQLLILCAKNSKGESPIDCAVAYEDFAISNEMLWILQDQIIPHVYPLIFRLMTMKSLHKISNEMLHYIYLSFLQGPNQSFAYQMHGKGVIKEIINVAGKLFQKNSGKEMLEASEVEFQHYMTGVRYSFKLDKKNQKRGMTHFCLAAQKLFTPAMAKVALFYAEGEIVPQNLPLAEKILKKIELMHNEPHPYIKARITKLKEAHQMKLKDKILSEKMIAELELKIKEIQDHPYYRSTLNKEVLTKFITEKSLSKVIQETTPSKKDLKNDWFQLPFVIWPYIPKAGLFKWTALYFKYPCSIETSIEFSNTLGVDIFLCEVTQMFRVTPQGIAICEESNGEIIIPSIPPFNNLEDFIQDMCSQEQGAIEGERYKKDAHNYKIISLAELREHNISIINFIKQRFSHQFDFKSPQHSIGLSVDPSSDVTFSRENIDFAEVIKASEESARQEEIERAKKQSLASVQNEPMVKFSISQKSTVTFSKIVGLKASGKSESNNNTDTYEQMPASKNKKG